MTEAEKRYEEVTGMKPDTDTALAVGLVWAIEQAPTLLDKIKVAREALEREREDTCKRYEM